MHTETGVAYQNREEQVWNNTPVSSCIKHKNHYWAVAVQ